MNLFNFLDFLPTLVFFGILMHFFSKLKGKNLTELIEKNTFLKDLTSTLTQQVNSEKKAAVEKKAPIKQDFINPPINGLEIKSSFGNVVRGVLLIIVLIMAGLYLQSHWGIF